MSETSATPAPSAAPSLPARPKTIGAVRVYNEAAFLPRWLDAAAKLFNEVIAIDDGSEDATPDILASHPIVTKVVRKKRGRQTDTQDHRKLTQLALDHGAEWIAFLDADEMWDERAVEVLPRLLSDTSVGEYKFRKYWFWGDEQTLRADHPEKYATWCLPRLVRASRSLKWNYPENADWKRLAAILIRQASWRTSYAYGRLDGIAGPVVEVPPEEVVLFHYAAVDDRRMLWKHIRNAVHNAREYPRRSGDDIADHWFKWIDPAIIETRPLPAEWRHLM